MVVRVWQSTLFAYVFQSDIHGVHFLFRTMTSVSCATLSSTTRRRSTRCRWMWLIWSKNHALFCSGPFYMFSLPLSHLTAYLPWRRRPYSVYGWGVVTGNHEGARLVDTAEIHSLQHIFSLSTLFAVTANKHIRISTLHSPLRPRPSMLSGNYLPLGMSNTLTLTSSVVTTIFAA